MHLRTSFTLSGSQSLYLSKSVDSCLWRDVISSSLVSKVSRSACSITMATQQPSSPSLTESSRPALTAFMSASRAAIFFSDWDNCSVRSASLRFLYMHNINIHNCVSAGLYIRSYVTVLHISDTLSSSYISSYINTFQLAKIYEISERLLINELINDQLYGAHKLQSPALHYKLLNYLIVHSKNRLKIHCN